MLAAELTKDNTARVDVPATAEAAVELLRKEFAGDIARCRARDIIAGAPNRTH